MSHLEMMKGPVVLVKCPEKWDEHKECPGILCIYACDTEKNQGKHWFRFIHDATPWSMAYLRCSVGKMNIDAEGGNISFDTESGSHYEFEPVSDWIPEGDADDISSYAEKEDQE